MKKTLFAISTIAVLLGFTACTNENETIEPQKGKTITIKAYTEETTRTALGGDDTNGYDVIWSAGDKIMIGTNEFTLSEGEGTTKGTFTGTATDGTYDAWYGVSSASLPVVQAYSEDKITNSPMHASMTITDGVASTANFKNLCGLLKLSLTGNVSLSAITISAGQAMAGAFTVGTDGGAIMASEGTCTYTTLKCGNVDITSSKDFYIALPAGEYSGVKIELADNTGKTFTKTLKSDKKLVITRSVITPATFTVGEFAEPETVNGHACVKLAGYYWATENVGAVVGVTPKYSGNDNNTNPYGCYFYTQNDAIKAAENWGSTWALPTAEQWNALVNGCNCTKTTQDGKDGYLYSDKEDPNKSIFLPAAGYFWSTSKYVEYQTGYNVQDLCYWASESGDALVYEAKTALPALKSSNGVETGFTVRPVVGSYTTE